MPQDFIKASPKSILEPQEETLTAQKEARNKKEYASQAKKITIQLDHLLCIPIKSLIKKAIIIYFRGREQPWSRGSLNWAFGQELTEITQA